MIIKKPSFLKRIVLIQTISGLISCAPVSNSGFTGDSKKANQQEQPAIATCSEARLIGISTSGQPAIDQSLADRTMRVELNIAPCLTASSPALLLDVSFDIDADWKTSSGGKPYDGMNIAYKIAHSEQSPQTDYLTFKFGSDLFGNSGPKYFQLSATHPVQIPNSVSVATMTIDLSNVLIVPRDTPQGNRSATVNFFLKIGQATPISGAMLVSQP